MNADTFRKSALRLPGASEGSHINHADFRVASRIFATLGYPDEKWAMVKLTPEQQEIVMAAEPDTFKPAAGAWGRKGSTHVLLEKLDAATAASVLRMAWENIASVPSRRGRRA